MCPAPERTTTDDAGFFLLTGILFRRRSTGYFRTHWHRPRTMTSHPLPIPPTARPTPSLRTRIATMRMMAYVPRGPKRLVRVHGSKGHFRGGGPSRGYFFRAGFFAPAFLAVDMPPTWRRGFRILIPPAPACPPPFERSFPGYHPPSRWACELKVFSRVVRFGQAPPGGPRCTVRRYLEHLNALARYRSYPRAPRRSPLSRHSRHFKVRKADLAEGLQAQEGSVDR
jgi:hypothetical protein